MSNRKHFHGFTSLISDRWASGTGGWELTKQQWTQRSQEFINKHVLSESTCNIWMLHKSQRSAFVLGSTAHKSKTGGYLPGMLWEKPRKCLCLYLLESPHLGGWNSTIIIAFFYTIWFPRQDGSEKMQTLLAELTSCWTTWCLVVWLYLKLKSENIGERGMKRRMPLRAGAGRVGVGNTQTGMRAGGVVLAKMSSPQPSTWDRTLLLTGGILHFTGEITSVFPGNKSCTP